MFMSTRYNKRSESSKQKQQKIFSVDDSLAKLCGYITNEFSCIKLITPKYKDFRSQKLKFDEKTRLNNAIWRAWHIQYKQNKKARFLQFAAPFSDISAHSTSQAVLLEGKYWRRRLDAVSREFKKWRRLYKEKLLRNGGLAREDIELSDIEQTSTENSDAENENDDGGNRSNNESSVTLDTFSAMYAFPDTLFSSVQKKKDNDLELSLFKDTSGIIQPTLDHLNPCFDELMENFDFLFTDWDNYNPENTSRGPTDLILDSNQYTQPGNKDTQPDISTRHFLPAITAENKSSHDNNKLTGRTLCGKQTVHYDHFSPNGPSKSASALIISSSESRVKEPDDQSPFQELPPQLQAPNLAAHVQAAMSNRPKSMPRNKSDPNLSTLAKRSASRKDTSLVQLKKPRIKRNVSGNNLLNEYSSVESKKAATEFSVMSSILSATTSQYQSTTCTTIPTAIKTTAIHILPKYTQSTAFPSATLNRAGILISHDLSNATQQNVRKPYTVPHSLSYAVIGGNSNMTQVSSNIGSGPTMVNAIPIVPYANQNVTQPNIIPTIIGGAAVISPTVSTFQGNFLPANYGILPQNDQQLLTLAHLLQSGPSQSTEATLNYLELLQQQLNLMVKQQQEQIQLKYQIQLQAEKLLQEKREQLNKQTHAPFCTDIGAHKQTRAPFCTDIGAHVEASHLHVMRSVPQQSTNTTFSSMAHNTMAAFTCDSPKAAFSSHSYLTSGRSFKSSPIDKDSSPDGSPKSFKNESQSLVKTLPPMRSSSSVLPNFFKINTSLNQTSTSMPLSEYRPPATMDSAMPPSEYRPPATMDSAIALVSLRHGQEAPEASSSGMYTKNYHSDASSPEVSNPAMQLSSTQIPKPITQVADRVVYNEHRRQCHLSAEQKRRGLIKNAFEELAYMIPNKGLSRGNKLSNAAILQLTCEHIQVLQRERASSDVRMNQVQLQIDEMQAAISECQHKLPTSGVSAVSRQGSDDVKRNFIAYCKDLIYKKPKSWIFCVMMRPLFDSFNVSVTTKTVDEFLNSVILWLDRHCTLPLLRPVVLETLTELSTSTPILDDPNCLSVLAENSLQNEDPCVLSSATNVTADTASVTSRWTSIWQK